MSQTFSFEESPFRLESPTELGVGEYAEPEVPDRELELFEFLHSDIEPEAEQPQYEEPEFVEPESFEPAVVSSEAEHPLSRFFRVPVAAVEALGKGSYAAALALLGSAGHRTENDLTNVIFYFRHPEALGRKIQPHERDLQRDWLQIRDTIVRPTLTRKATAPSSGRTSIPSSGLRWYGTTDETPELLTFLRAVYDRHVALSTGGFVDTLPESTLKVVEGKHRARIPAADAAIRMLAAARADLAKTDHPDLLIGITSAYRSADEQFAIWQGKGRGGKRGFPHYYNETAAQRAATGNPHGPASVLLLAKVMKKYIAAPGFSNHQDGLALDLGTAAKGKPLGKIGHNAWFYKWLATNAKSHDFHPYTAEPWHWVYRPTPTASESWQPSNPFGPSGTEQEGEPEYLDDSEDPPAAESEQLDDLYD